MKHIYILTIFLFAMNQTHAITGAKESDTFPSAPEEVFTPMGFDSNDNVEVFFEGQFSSTCFKVGLTVHTVDEESKRIFITDTAHYFGEAFCAAVMVPYQKGINAGMLTPGEYTVYFRHSRGNFVEQALVTVREATQNSPDDHIYAPVKSAQYLPGVEGGPGQLRLLGEYSAECMDFDRVEVVQRPDSNVVDILPIMALKRSSCHESGEQVPFIQHVDLRDLQPGRVLLHVRAMNGQSVNEIVTVR